MQTSELDRQCFLADPSSPPPEDILCTEQEIFNEGSATKEISYTSWRNQLKSWEIKAWNQARKSAQPSSPTHFYNIWRHFWGKSRGKSKRNQEISYAKIARCRPLDLQLVDCLGYQQSLRTWWNFWENAQRNCYIYHTSLNRAFQSVTHMWENSFKVEIVICCSNP